MLGRLPVRKSTATVSTTAFILGDLEGERAWLSGACGCRACACAPLSGRSSLRHPEPGTWQSLEPRSQSPSSELGGQRSWRRQQRTWGECSASESSVPGAYLCPQQTRAGG